MKAIKLIESNIYLFYLRPYYCITLYQMQGSTVNTGRLSALDDVLDTNILKNFYVLISRCKNFKNIILSDNIMQRVLKKLNE